ncbi:uncharacterized protein LOC121373723 [Gigantopelta aegis]|uniref:uncharacterized protein LOC121373723 n=1 Tax=Gigantopelta aegis TaxID=1735272 RepID=UPI001B88B67F|nr:uncharacterized protein LOC121373723 [Gigantopelta aegis]XP_041356408.1 uncharacterized protein LOC121373723 [Gigantopelta aegis]XP_041356409.1 uncharacterized protein LOC121373723 [Gigantopelta aegis]
MTTAKWFFVVLGIWICCVNGMWLPWERVTVEECSPRCKRRVLLQRNCTRDSPCNGQKNCAGQATCSGSQSKWTREVCASDQCPQIPDSMAVNRQSPNEQKQSRSSFPLSTVIVVVLVLSLAVTAITALTVFRCKGIGLRKTTDIERIVSYKSDVSFSSSDHEFDAISTISGARIDIFQQKNPPSVLDTNREGMDNPSFSDSLHYTVNPASQ